jgi:chromosome segregation ATPase
MNIDEALKIVCEKAAGRTRYPGQPDFVDEVLAAEIERLTKERDEADRRAGASERRIADLQDTVIRRNDWLHKAKVEAGYHDNVSFDVVWNETLAKAKEVERLTAEIAGCVELIPARLRIVVRESGGLETPEATLAVSVAKMAQEVERLRTELDGRVSEVGTLNVAIRDGEAEVVRLRNIMREFLDARLALEKETEGYAEGQLLSENGLYYRDRMRAAVRQMAAEAMKGTT